MHVDRAADTVCSEASECGTFQRVEAPQGRGTTRVRKIVSGGQTGADRAGLDVAIALGIPHGGWCPRGRRTEDGPLPPHYQLKETESSSYTQRTTWNVRDSDATVVFSMGRLGPGSANTMKAAQAFGRPRLHVNLSTLELSGTSTADIGALIDSGIPVLVDATALPEEASNEQRHDRRLAAFRRWLVDNKVETLNVAGSRESTSPGISNAVKDLLLRALR